MEPVVATHVLVPLKRLDGAKSRLAGLLTAAERVALMEAMLAGVLAAVREARGVEALTLVSSEPTAASLAASHGVGCWNDRGLAWNEALAAAMREVVRAPCAAVVSADLPLLAAAEVSALLEAVPERGVAIARALDGGTNAVAMRPPGAAETCFGSPGSSGLHAELAAGAGVDAVVLDVPGLALDLDCRADAERLVAAAPTSAAALLLAGILERSPA